MNKTRLNKIMLGIAFIGLTGVAGAQWQVDIPTTATFTQTFAQVMNSLKASIDNTTTQLDIGRKQAAQLQADTDARNRYAAIEAKTAQDIAAIYPTLQACAELTNRQMGIGAMKASVAGGSSGGSPGARTLGGMAASIKSEGSKLSAMIDQKTKLQTCSQSDVAGRVGDCASVGNYGGNEDPQQNVSIPSSDVSSLSLKGNTDKSQKIDQKSEFANYSIDAKGIDVAYQYIHNATQYNIPKALPDDKLKANPEYKSLYDAVMVKLNGAQQAMKDILAMRKVGAMPASGPARDYWEKNKGKYEVIFGMRQPPSPSTIDIIKFNVANDYFGVPDNTNPDEKTLLTQINQRLALSNLIAIKQMDQQENSNILLALLLTQQVTPADAGKLNDLYKKIINDKATGSN